MTRDLSRYFNDLKTCGSKYKEVVDELISSGLEYKKMVACVQFINKSKYDAFIYFYENYLCCNCRCSYEGDLLRTLAMSPPYRGINTDLETDNVLYKELLEYLFARGVYPDQVCMDRCQYCTCQCKNACHTTEDCKCEYHCSDTSFFIAVTNNNHVFVEIGLKYIDPRKDSILFKNGCINKVLLSMYIRRSDERVLIMLHQFYQKHVDSMISMDDFKIANFDYKKHSCHRSCLCVPPQPQSSPPQCTQHNHNHTALLNTITALENTVRELKETVLREPRCC